MQRKILNIMTSWRKGTTKQYRSYLSRWTEFCKRQNISPYSPGTTKAIEFLTELFHSGVGYGAINTARSALSSIILSTAGTPFGKDPLVCRFLKGVFELKPCFPKYSQIWDVNTVLSHLTKFGTVDMMTLKDVTMNLATLLCLLTGQRCQTIHNIDINFIQFHDEGCIITIREVLKHTKTGKHQPPLELRSYSNDERLSIITYLSEYIIRTVGLRKEQSQLLISFNKPHKAVSKYIVARWVKNTLKQSGIDTEQFTSHSTRSASTSCAKAVGLNLEKIMLSAGWSTTSTFGKFCDKHVETILENIQYIIYNSPHQFYIYNTILLRG